MSQVQKSNPYEMANFITKILFWIQVCCISFVIISGIFFGLEDTDILIITIPLSILLLIMIYIYYLIYKLSPCLDKTWVRFIIYTIFLFNIIFGLYALFAKNMLASEVIGTSINVITSIVYYHRLWNREAIRYANAKEYPKSI